MSVGAVPHSSLKPVPSYVYIRRSGVTSERISTPSEPSQNPEANACNLECCEHPQPPSKEKPVMKKIAVILVALVSAFAPKQMERKSDRTRVDQLLDRPDLRGVASVHIDSAKARFIAIWTENPQSQTLEIYEMSKYPTVRLVNQFEDRDVPFQSLTAIQDGAVAGFQVRRTTGEDWFGATLLYFYVAGKFMKVFETGDVAELLDVNGDGYPEVLEYQGDRSDPSCKVKISVWKDDKYQYLTTVPLSQLFLRRTRNRISQFLKSAPNANDAIQEHKNRIPP
jgi:hypothetical protein